MKTVDFADVSDATRLLLHVVTAPWLPWRVEVRVAGWVGDVSSPLLRGMRKSISDGLHVGLDGDEKTRDVPALARANIRDRWAQREIVWLWRLTRSPRRRQAMCRRVRIEGGERVRDTLSHGRGAILVESHLGKRVLARVALCEAGFGPCQVVHASRHFGSPTWVGQRVMRRLRLRLEAKLGFEVVEIEEGSLGYLRRLPRWLARGGVACTSGVGNSGYKFVAVEFLGAPAYFSTGPASLARMAGVPLLPVFTFEDLDGTDHVVVETPIHVPSEAAGDAALVDVVGQYVRLLERYVRAHPEQWSWWHALPTPTAAQLAGGVIGRP